MATNTTALHDFGVSDDEQTDESGDEIECACELDEDLGCFEHYEVAQ